MQKKFYLRVKTEAELRVAIDEKQLKLYYQPVINPETNQILGLEALVRWQVGDELRMPDQFISVAEDTRQIIPIGDWVMEEAISTLAQWNKKYNRSLTMAVNVSAHQLSDTHLVQHWKDCLERHNVPAELIDIEITETALLKDTIETHNTLIGLSDLKCRLSLDDFGTGYSSISHLRNYPISVVKIDKSLIPLNDRDIRKIALMKGLVSMASILGLEVIAEGVETKYQVSLCKAFSILHVQGYYYAKPLHQKDIENKYLNNTETKIN